MNAPNYESERRNGIKRLALTWDQIVIEAKLAIGEEDCKAWLDDIEDIISSPYFIRDPVPYEFAAETRARNKFPHVIGKTWISPHPEAYHKLGYYQIWRPNKEVENVFGEKEVRKALSENLL